MQVATKTYCNPGIEFSIPGSGSKIEKFLIPGSRDPVSGLGLQNGRSFGIHSRLMSCMGCSRPTVRKVGLLQVQGRSDCICDCKTQIRPKSAQKK